jgi:hypothetical protein
VHQKMSAMGVRRQSEVAQPVHGVDGAPGAIDLTEPSCGDRGRHKGLLAKIVDQHKIALCFPVHLGVDQPVPVR